MNTDKCKGCKNMQYTMWIGGSLIPICTEHIVLDTVCNSYEPADDLLYTMLKNDLIESLLMESPYEPPHL